MATLLKTFTGPYAGPGPSYFRVVAQLYQNKDTGNGYDLYLRRYIEVKSGSSFGGTIVSTAWAGSVTLNGAGNAGSKDTQLGTIAYGNVYSLAANSTRAYYSDSAGHTYSSSIAVSYTVPNPTYTLTFDPNGGELLNPGDNLFNGTNNDSVTVTYLKGDYGRMLDDIPLREGHTFAGWYTTRDGGVQVYDEVGYGVAGTYWDANRKWIYKGDLTVYAHWTADTYKVVYDANGGVDVPAAQVKTYGIELSLSKQEPTRKGHKFVGWNTKADGTGQTYSPGGIYIANTGVTLYAIWKRQDDVRVNTGDSYKRGRVIIKTSETYKTGKVRIKVNGVWRKGD